MEYYRDGKDGRFFDRNADIKDDWRNLFLARTAQLLLHSSNPSLLKISVAHSGRCMGRSAIAGDTDCGCWKCGVDSTHRILLQRLMAIPRRSEIAQCYSSLKQRASHFRDERKLKYGELLLIPFRYARYFTENFKITAVVLLKMLSTDYHLRPKFLPISCEYMYFSELYQIYLSRKNSQPPNSAHSLLAEFLSELERAEFYWVGRMKDTDTFGRPVPNAPVNPTFPIPKLFLEAVLKNPLPKLNMVCFRMFASASTGDRVHAFLKLDNCVKDIAPFFSPGHNENSKTLPISTPYAGLKKVHFIGDIASIECGRAISSIVLHQCSLEGLEIACTSESVVSSSSVLDPIMEVIVQPQVKFFSCSSWTEYDFGFIFHRFLEANQDYEISLMLGGHKIVVPAHTVGSTSPSLGHKVLKFSPHNGSYKAVAANVFSWLQQIKLDRPILSITIAGYLDGCDEIPFVSNCRSLKFDIQGDVSMLMAERSASNPRLQDPALPLFVTNRIASAPSLVIPKTYFSSIALNPNLQSLTLDGLSFSLIIDDVLKLLRSVFASSPHLTELSFKNSKLGSLPRKKLVEFFECVFSCPHPEQLSVDLWGNRVDTDVMLEVWRKVAKGKRMKSIIAMDLQTKVEEMVLQEIK